MTALFCCVYHQVNSDTQECFVVVVVVVFLLQVIESKLIEKKTKAGLVTLFAEYQQGQQPMTDQSLLSFTAC